MKNTLFFVLNILLYLSTSAQATEKPNIILIYVDDLNDYGLSVNGHPQAQFEGMQFLADNGTVFYNTHASSPKCAPSRASMLSGKDVSYVQIYNNPECRPFTDYFKPAFDNEEYYTLPGVLKDNGYYTYGLNKIFHCFDSYPDFDTANVNACDKGLSWNKFSLFMDKEDSMILDLAGDIDNGLKDMKNAVLNDTLEKYLYDYRAIDSVLNFVGGVQSGTVSTCDRPVFIAVGLRRPHSPWYIPEKYYSPDYNIDYYSTVYNLPYNNPANSYPLNGTEPAPQPDTMYHDFEQLGPLGKVFAGVDSTYFNLLEQINDFDPLPEFGGGLTDEEASAILSESIKANNLISYLAASRFTDAQVKRLIDSLSAYPDFYNNTIIIFASDNGYSLGEKRHWQKGTLWDADLRVPFIIADLRNPVSQSVYSSVSLLDVFPTVCALTDVPYPLFADGTSYLDGKNLLPLLNNPELPIEHPVVATYKEQDVFQCSCFPQFSVRNQDFHFIYYTSNNEDTLLDCNAELAWNEAELYEVGDHFENDPHEWTNLIQNADYLPVVNYLQQWLPDSALYLKSTYKLIIDTITSECYVTDTAVLPLSFHIYDETGAAIFAPEGFVYRWTNNGNSDTLYGTSVDLDMTTLDAAFYAENSELLIFIEMVDTINNIVVGLDLDKVAINPANEPAGSFDLVSIGDNLVAVNNIHITGEYSAYWWDIGFGPMFYNSSPGPITFPEAGEYVIKLFIQYGNSGNCLKEISESIILTTTLDNSENNLIIYPNPGSNVLFLEAPVTFEKTRITFYDISGREVYMTNVDSQEKRIQVPINNLSSGTYLVHIDSKDMNQYIRYIHIE